MDSSPDNNTNIAQLIAERDFYKKILDNIPAIVHINNLDKETIEWVNQRVELMSGYKPEDIVSNRDFLPSVVVADDHQWMYDSIDIIRQLQNESTSYIYSIRHANGQVVTYQGCCVVFDKDELGKPLSNLAIDIDITHEIANYQQLKRHLDEMTRQLHRTQLDNLTKTEKQIISLLCQGKSIKAIAQAQNRSHYTIDNHKRHVFAKLGINKTSQLVKWANEVGFC
jgi:PAS domain S-box-containing protein